MGTIGKIGTYSFNIFKTINAGDGGMVVTDEDELYVRAIGYHDQGHFPSGATWIGRRWQRTRVNTEAKYLMLRHAFETLGDSLNERSRRAILRIGAVEEGVFRNHVITADGRIRYSVLFSITAPGVVRGSGNDWKGCLEWHRHEPVPTNHNRSCQ